MSYHTIAFTGAAIHDGSVLHEDKALLCLSDGQAHIVALSALPDKAILRQLPGGTILPGFVDLQVNGGGGVMFNDDQSIDALQKIAEAHTRIGSAAILPTLITDTPEKTRAAILAVEQAIDQKVPGIAGIHLEGPHLSVARKGAHDPGLIRPMNGNDLTLLLDTADRLPNVMLTVAPENCTLDQIRQLSRAGIVVSLGHTDASYDECMAAFDAGATCVTHLFNAMSQLGNRNPGLVGATMAHGGVYAGLIADGVHVHPAAIRAALANEGREKRIFLVTDAMATAGSEITSFTLNDRLVKRQDGRLSLPDDTLAGADLELARAISVMENDVGSNRTDAITRATSLPSELLRQNESFGRFQGSLTNMFYLDGGSRKIGPLDDQWNVNNDPGNYTACAS